jgi:hypothetical protein
MLIEFAPSVNDAPIGFDITRMSLSRRMEDIWPMRDLNLLGRHVM